MYKHILIAFTIFSYFSLFLLLCLLFTVLVFLFSGYYCSLVRQLKLHSYLVYVSDCIVCAGLEWAFSLPLNIILLLVSRFYLCRYPSFCLSDLKDSLVKLGSVCSSLLASLSLADVLAFIFTCVFLIVILFLGLFFWLC